MPETRTAIIIGGGPAGLTAAFELLDKTDIVPIVFEASDDVGGISRTYHYKGNYIDLGGHRFFSKSTRVIDWWRQFLPIEADSDELVEIRYQNATATIDPGEASAEDANRMLVRRRVSRILFEGQLFDYPLSLSVSTIMKLGLGKTARAGLSYLRARLWPRRQEVNLEDFLVNRFGHFLYDRFFREYTHKVWGVACSEISAEWGRQRIKGLSIIAILKDAFRKRFLAADVSIGQKSTETSLIERFLYPKYGPGQMWRRVADEVREKGGEIRFNQTIVGVESRDGKIIAVRVKDQREGTERRIEGDYFFSSMPVRDLIAAMTPPPPPEVQTVADGLLYRNFMTVGLLVRSLAIGGGVSATELADRLPDNWIYVQEPGVSVGRIQIFNNWSPYLVADPENIWIGLEYFLDDADRLWNAEEQEITAFAITEMERIDFLDAGAVLDSTVIKQAKAYPAYFGTYGDFGVIRDYADLFTNLYPIGRNGQHRYNNQDHSMLTAMVSVAHIAGEVAEKKILWDVNTESEYLEE